MAPKRIRPSTSSGCEDASRIETAPPAEDPSMKVFSAPSAASMARRSSTVSCSAGGESTRSERPVPRRSGRKTRAKRPSRSKKASDSGSESIASICEVKLGMKTRLTGPSPMTVYASATPSRRT
jgi:hypothetical protein